MRIRRSPSSAPRAELLPRLREKLWEIEATLRADEAMSRFLCGRDLHAGPGELAGHSLAICAKGP